MSRTFYLVVTRTTDQQTRIVDLPTDAYDMDGWNELVRGWSIGPASTGAYVRLDEPDLANVRVGVFPASNHVLLWGHVASGRTLPQSLEHMLSSSQPGQLSVRFDRRPLRIGSHVIQFFYDKPGSDC